MSKRKSYRANLISQNQRPANVPITDGLIEFPRERTLPENPYPENLSLLHRVLMSPPYATSFFAAVFVLVALILSLPFALLGGIRAGLITALVLLTLTSFPLYWCVQAYYPKRNPHLSELENYKLYYAYYWLRDRYRYEFVDDEQMADTIAHFKTFKIIPRDIALKIIAHAENTGLTIQLREDPLRPGRYVMPF